MKWYSLMLGMISFLPFSYAQNVGIGTNTPTGPLSFSDNTGNKIVLKGDGNTNHSGIGAQIGQLQFYVANSNESIVFGIGRSNSFFERMRITGGGWVGIGWNNPNAPLTFAPLLGKKITLYPGATGDVGFGVAGNRLQIFSDNPNADVAIGYDAANVFNERFAFKPNGALALQGNLGSNGYSLVSRGNAAVEWAPPISSSIAVPVDSDISLTYSTGANMMAELPNIQMTVTVPSGQNARLFLNATVVTRNNGCTGLGCSAYGYFYFKVNDVMSRKVKFDTENGTNGNVSHTMYPWDVGPGTYTIKWYVEKSTSAVNIISITPIVASTLVVPR